MPKRTHQPNLPPVDESKFRLSEGQFSQIDSLVRYTFSEENQSRLSLLKRVGPEALARIEKHIGKEHKGADRQARYQDMQQAFNSKVFLSDKHACAAGPSVAQATEGTQAGMQTPTSNTGVTNKTQPQAGDWETAEKIQLLIGSGRNAKLLEVPKRVGHNGSAAFPDWVHVTIGKETCDQYADFLNSDEERVLVLSYRLERIFGFGVTVKHKNGRNFYAESFGLGNEKESWGYVCIGGNQEDTILIGITGTGCTAAKPGWEERLVNWLETEADRPKLTRVDLAFDDFEGKLYDVERAENDYHAGGFQCYHGTCPDAERIGTDWIKLEKQRQEWEQICAEAAEKGVEPQEPKKFSSWLRRGRTFAVGRRSSGKYFRGYERGRKLGDSKSNWFRVEVEFKAIERVLPFDMLLNPGKYLAGAYPCLNWINQTQDRILTHKKQLEITLQSSVDFVKKQAGQHINVLVEALGLDGFLEQVRREGIPKRFKVADLLTAPNPIRISDRLAGLQSNELNALIDLHMAGHAVPGAIFGHRSESPSFRPI